MAGCEEGWCWHYRDWTEYFEPEEVLSYSCDLSSSRPMEIVPTQVQSTDNFFNGFEERENIPKFDTFEAFKSSDMFSEYYDMWDMDLEWKWMWNICEAEQEKILWEAWQVLMLRPVVNQQNRFYSENLQRILLGLWYLSRDNLDPTRTYDSESPFRETQIIYLWALWQMEHIAIRQFQTNNNLEANWIISLIEKNILYTQIFQNFHSLDEQ